MLPADSARADPFRACAAADRGDAARAAGRNPASFVGVVIVDCSGAGCRCDAGVAAPAGGSAADSSEPVLLPHAVVNNAMARIPGISFNTCVLLSSDVSQCLDS